MKITIQTLCGNFAENKDIAKEIREKSILPILRNTRQKIEIDFEGVDSSTQSFIHALISQAFQEFGEKALSRFDFSNCNKAVKSLIGTVVNYSLE